MPALLQFLFPRRLHRLAYFLRLSVANTAMYFFEEDSGATNAWIFWGIIIILAAYELFFIVLPRIRDAGMSGWWLLLIPIPIPNVLLGILLLFRRPHYGIGSSPAAGITLPDSEPVASPATSPHPL